MIFELCCYIAVIKIPGFNKIIFSLIQSNGQEGSEILMENELHPYLQIEFNLPSIKNVLVQLLGSSTQIQYCSILQSEEQPSYFYVFPSSHYSFTLISPSPHNEEHYPRVSFHGSTYPSHVQLELQGPHKVKF